VGTPQKGVEIIKNSSGAGERDNTTLGETAIL
jgi:hypothetical protein